MEKTLLLNICAKYSQQWRQGFLSLQDVRNSLAFDTRARVTFDGKHFGIWWSKDHYAIIKMTAGNKAVTLKYC